MAKLKVGVIGVGGIARSHFPGWEASEHAEIVAGSDINPKVLDTFAEKTGATKSPAAICTVEPEAGLRACEWMYR